MKLCTLNNLLATRDQYWSSVEKKSKRFKLKDLDDKELTKIYLFSCLFSNQNIEQNKICVTFQDLSEMLHKNNHNTTTPKKSKLSEYFKKSLFLDEKLKELKQTKSQEDSFFYAYTQNMLFGIIGQSVKDFYINDTYKEFLVNIGDETFEYVAKETVSLRHSIMHIKDSLTRETNIANWKQTIFSINFNILFTDGNLVQKFKSTWPEITTFELLEIKSKQMNWFIDFKKYDKLIKICEYDKTIQTHLSNDKLIIKYAPSFLIDYLSARQTCKGFEDLLVSLSNYSKMYNLKNFYETVQSFFLKMMVTSEKVRNFDHDSLGGKLTLSEKYLNEKNYEQFLKINDKLINDACISSDNEDKLFFAYYQRILYAIETDSPGVLLEYVTKIIDLVAEKFSSDADNPLSCIYVLKPLLFQKYLKIKSGGTGRSQDAEAFQKVYEKISGCEENILKITKSVLVNLRDLYVNACGKITSNEKITQTFLNDIRKYLEEGEIRYSNHKENFTDQDFQVIGFLYEYILNFEKAFKYYYLMKETRVNEFSIFATFFKINSKCLENVDHEMYDFYFDLTERCMNQASVEQDKSLLVDIVKNYEYLLSRLKIVNRSCEAALLSRYFLLNIVTIINSTTFTDDKDYCVHGLSLLQDFAQTSTPKSRSCYEAKWRLLNLNLNLFMGLIERVG